MHVPSLFTVPDTIEGGFGVLRRKTIGSEAVILASTTKFLQAIKQIWMYKIYLFYLRFYSLASAYKIHHVRYVHICLHQMTCMILKMLKLKFLYTIFLETIIFRIQADILLYTNLHRGFFWKFVKSSITGQNYSYPNKNVRTVWSFPRSLLSGTVNQIIRSRISLVKKHMSIVLCANYCLENNS